jgi:class 3 adenylate cyclase/predicted ATPase
VIGFKGEAARSGAMNDLKAWLERLGLGQHFQILAENDVDLDVLPQLSDGDLKELGLSLGHRRKLLAALREPPAPVEPESAPRTEAEPETDAERRQLTVMFCDLVGSTELSQKLDPEELREVLRRYHDTVARIITGHQGHVAKLLGDGVLAYFGWPHAHEDQAEQAVHAALAATAAVGGIEGAGEPLSARAGIATGQVVIGDMKGEAMQERGAVAGETPNLAARLQGVAQQGEVVINDATRRLTRGFFVLEAGGAHPLKGFAEPVAVWRVTGAARAGSRFEAAHETDLTELVGRTHEIGLLLDRWDRARSGEGQVVLVSGEAGIGKSRILREFISRLGGQDHRILRYQCSAHEVNAAFQPVIAEIETTAGFQPDDPATTRRDKLDRHLAAAFGKAGEAAPLIAGLLSLPLEGYPPLDMAPQRRKQHTVMALVDRISMLSRKQPVVMMVEDIHWIDASSMEILDTLVERVQDLPVLAVMAYRPEFVPQWDGHGHVTVLSLNRLGRGGGRAIAERITGGKVLPDEVLSRILEQTDGIPLFVEELTKTVLEAGFMEEQADRFVLSGPLPAVAIPETLHDSLMARLDRMAPVKRVIQGAACIGREFSAELLATALPMGAGDLENALGQLLDAQLIFRRGAAESANYIFKHALVQDAAYASLLVATRRSLHERLALALEQTDDPDPLALARHFSVAGAKQRAAGLYLSAGRRSLGDSALPEAIGALELGLGEMEAIAASPDRDRLELGLRVALGTARMATFGWAHPSVADALEPAFPLAKAFGDRDALGSILWGLWVHYQTRTEFPKAHEWLTELEMVACENPGSDLPLVYDMSAGCQYFWEADYPRALGFTRHLKTIYDPEKHAGIVALTNHDPLVFALHWAGSFADWITGYPDRSLERLEEAISLARRAGHPFNRAFAMTAGVSSLFYRGEAEAVLTFVDEVEGIVEEEALGQFSQNVLVNQWRGAAYIFLGRFEEGYPLIKQGNDFWNMAGGRVGNAGFWSWTALGLWGLGRIDEAASLIGSTIRHCRKTGDRYMEPECVRLRGELALLTPDPGIEAAEGSFREAMAIAQAHGAKSWELRAAMSLARLLGGTRNRRTDAVACLEPVLNRFTEGQDTSDLRQAAGLLSELA